jgi:hypothetical protein
MLAAVAIAIRQAATVDQLLNQWRGQGWSQIRNGVLRQVPVSVSTGKPLVQLQIDAIEWVDVTVFGIGNLDDALQRLRNLIQQGGSDLYGYSLLRRTDVDFLGIKVVRYRLVLAHSLVQLLVAAIAILAIAFAAVIFYQYVTTGAFPTAKDLQGMWAGILKPVSDAVQAPIQGATQGIANVYILGIGLAGAVAIAFGMASKSTGVKIREPKAPGGSIGVRSGPVSARLSS